MGDDDESVVSLSEQTRRPLDTALRQQRVDAWYPILHPWWVIGTFVILGAIFVPVGESLSGLNFVALIISSLLSTTQLIAWER